MNAIIRTLWKSSQQFLDDDCLSSGAAMGFYTIFSLPPLLVIVLMITSSLGFSKQEVDHIIHDQLGFPATETVISTPLPGAGVIPQTIPESDDSGPSVGKTINRFVPFKIGDLGLVSKLVGIAVLLFSATGSFGQLQFSLNRIWKVEPDPQEGWIRSFFLKRLLTAGMVIVIGFVLLVSLILTTMIDQILSIIIGDSPGPVAQIFGLVLNEAAAFVIAMLLFAAMFKLLPDAKLRWRDVWVGAVVTALLFVIGKAGIGWYLRSSQIGSSWGASAASSVAALVWVYYSSLIVLFGAELTNAGVTQNGASRAPAAGAVRTIKEKRHIRDVA